MVFLLERAWLSWPFFCGAFLGTGWVSVIWFGTDLATGSWTDIAVFRCEVWVLTDAVVHNEAGAANTLFAQMEL